MKDTIRIKSGKLGERTAMPRLDEDELGFQTEEEALYIGTRTKNLRLCGASDATDIETLKNEVTTLRGYINSQNAIIAGINARLEALEAKNEQEGS